MLPVYPDGSLLRGLAFSTKWSPVFFSMPTATTADGTDIDMSLSPYPLHNFELKYEFLRDNWSMNTGSSEFKTMMGFFLRIGGVSGRFLFRHKDDCWVNAQAIGTGDGSTASWTIVRTYGIGANSGTEPVGYLDYLDRTYPPVVYLNGVVQPITSYYFTQTTPCLQKLTFYSPPPAGASITMDFGYFYYCKMNDDTATFEKFMDRLWLLNSVKIHSCRAGG